MTCPKGHRWKCTLLFMCNLWTFQMVLWVDTQDASPGLQGAWPSVKSMWKRCRLRGREGGGTLDGAGRLWGAWKWPDGAAATDQPLTTLSFTVILRACLKYPTFSFHIMRLHTLKFKIGFIQFLPINHLINYINNLIDHTKQSFQKVLTSVQPLSF